MITHRIARPFPLGLAAACLFAAASVLRAQDATPLPSWNDGAAKRAIVEFVGRVTTEGSSDFVPAAERIAVFDNDGTLWCEQPVYAQVAFVLDAVGQMAASHADWKDKEPFKSILAGNAAAALGGDEHALVELFTATHAGMTTAEFEASVRDWLARAKHPKFGRPYNECVYQPMVEVLAYLRARGFKTFIVSGGGVEFMRVWAEDAYGIPPEQVVGSSGKLRYEVRDGAPVIEKLPELDFMDDGPGKPVGIQRFIGRRPILAFGNSDGDFEMLEWTTTGPGARLGLIVHHTDAEREYAYDRESRVGKLKRGLDEAAERGWVLIDMKTDWKSVFPN